MLSRRFRSWLAAAAVLGFAVVAQAQEPQAPPKAPPQAPPKAPPQAPPKAPPAAPPKVTPQHHHGVPPKTAPQG